MSTIFTNGYAFLIGVNENQVPAWSLPVVAQDVSALRDVLVHPERCGYSPDHVKVISGANASRQAILDGLDWLRAEIETCGAMNATVIVYFSGHGLRSGSTDRPEYYLVPYDVRETTLVSRSLSARDFAASISAIQPGRLLLLLDCCHAGGVSAKGTIANGNVFQSTAIPVDVLGDRDEQAVASPNCKGLEQLQIGRGRAVLSSSQGAQSSYIRRDNRMSIFTHCLIEALTGYAALRHDEKEVLVSDLMSYVYRHVPQRARTECNAEQTPDFQVSGNFAVAVLLGGKGLQGDVPLPDPLRPPDSAADSSGRGDSVQQVGDTAGPKATVTKGNTIVIQGSGHQITGDIVGGNKVVLTPSEQ